LNISLTFTRNFFSNPTYLHSEPKTSHLIYGNNKQQNCQHSI